MKNLGLYFLILGFVMILTQVGCSEEKEETSSSNGIPATISGSKY